MNGSRTRGRSRLVAPALALLLTSAGIAPSRAQDPVAKPAPLAADRRAALDRISADSLQGHLSFLASDLLEGRETPSRGLDLAAEYIASQYRRAGLEPVGDDGYFQTARWKLVEADSEGFRLDLRPGVGPALDIRASKVQLARLAGFDVADAAMVRIDAVESPALESIARETVAGRVVLVSLPEPAPRGGRGGLAAAAFQSRMVALGAPLIVNVGREPGRPTGLSARQLIDPESPRPPARSDRPGPPIVTVFDPAVAGLLAAMPVGVPSGKASCHLGAPVERPVAIRNVVGVLRGSDPALRDTYVMVTAHYDHLGNRGAADASGDRTFNGANDDASGTGSVIEIASALASLRERPRRSILFATFFGEELGLLGSRHYGRHPVVPIERTIADLNLEQLGRTDDSEGPRVASAALTGFGYSDVSKALVEGARAEGVAVVGHPQFSDAFFSRSDNQALADLGVPAHTLCVAFQYPDYHGLADHWDRLDYPNMARVDRAVARTLLEIADSTTEPKWNPANPRAARYLKAWTDRRSAAKPSSDR